jgi:hypothetical protein
MYSPKGLNYNIFKINVNWYSLRGFGYKEFPKFSSIDTVSTVQMPLVYKLLLNKYSLHFRWEQFSNYCLIDAVSTASDTNMIQITS